MDGFRALAYVDGDTCRLVSRNWNAIKTFEPLAHGAGAVSEGVSSVPIGAGHADRCRPATAGRMHRSKKVHAAASTCRTSAVHLAPDARSHRPGWQTGQRVHGLWLARAPQMFERVPVARYQPAGVSLNIGQSPKTVHLRLEDLRVEENATSGRLSLALSAVSSFVRV